MYITGFLMAIIIQYNVLNGLVPQTTIVPLTLTLGKPNPKRLFCITPNTDSPQIVFDRTH